MHRRVLKKKNKHIGGTGVLVTLDFETYYDQEYSLRKLTTAEYVNDPRFFIHMVGVKIDNGPTIVASDEAGIANLLYSIDWEEATLNCQNTHFDGFILASHFSLYPAKYSDTRSMSQALYVGEKSHSLAAIADRLFEDRKKGEELSDSKGVERLTGDLLLSIREYCINDVELTYSAYQEMIEYMPDREMELIDLTARMFCQPKLLLDVERAASSLCDIQDAKKEIIKKSGLQKTKLASNPQFATWIRENGMEPPKKVSATTGKETWALGKNDLAFQQLIADHPEHDAVWQARLEAKSTIAEKRTERFIRHAEVNEGRMPVPLNYYGAHTGRFSGRDKINFQNLQRGSELRKCLIAPDGYQVLVVDSSNIEARMLAWLAGQKDVLEVFRSGGDVYADMASKIYGHPVNKKDHPTERFVGKTAVLGLGYGMSAAKFKMTLATGAMGPRVDVTDEEAEKIVRTYRKSNAFVTSLWKTFQKAIEYMVDPKGTWKVKELLPLGHRRIELPNGLYLRYPNLRYNISRANNEYGFHGEIEYIYGENTRIYGGKLTENVIQALARIVVCEQMLDIDEVLQEVGGSVVLTVHDEIVAIVPDEHAEAMYEMALDVMRTAPQWAEGLPLDAEGGVAKEYSK
jgi:DNA polymerase